MDTWTVQMGYPVVKVQRDYASGGAMADQDRFLLTPANPQHLLQDNASYTWWVPISWTTPELGFDTTYPSDWLDPARAGTDTALSLSGLEVSQPLIVNVQQTGFYRVNYDLENWNLLADQLIDNHTSIHRVNRAQIIDDARGLPVREAAHLPAGGLVWAGQPAVHRVLHLSPRRVDELPGPGLLLPYPHLPAVHYPLHWHRSGQSYPLGLPVAALPQQQQRQREGKDHGRAGLHEGDLAAAAVSGHGLG